MRWPKDSHFILYHAVDEAGEPVFARVSKRSPFVGELMQMGGAIRVTILAFDYDLPKGPGGEKAVWSEEGLGEFVQGLSGADLPSPTAFYTTLHGARFVYALTTPVDHLIAEGLARAISEKYAAAGVELDPACKDWTRLFRLPYTVRQDSGAEYDALLVQDGPPLDPSTIAVTVAAPEKFAPVEQYSAPMPDPDACLAMLTKTSEAGRPVASDLVVEARKYLQGRESFAVCFEDGAIDVSEGWNNGLTKLIGQVVGMLARSEHATPEGVFALLYAGLEQLQVAEDQGAAQTQWLPTAWDLVCRMWANEQAQVAAERAEREQSIARAKVVKAELIERVKADLPGQVPAEPEAAEAWLKQRMIASDGYHHHVMRPDGSYNVKSVRDSMLVPLIRELGMEDVIECNELRGKSWVPRSAQTILNEHATPIIAVRCSSRERAAYIDGEAGYRTLHIPVHRLNPKAKPVRSPRVEEWLAALFGSKLDLGLEWLAWAPEVSTAICALNLYGTSGTGKGMLAQGLAECFEGEQINDSRALSKFNIGLLYSPVVNCDEGLPRMTAEGAVSLDQAFRSLVSGGNISVEGKGTNFVNANVYPRILFTSNDRDILRSIVGHRDLNDDDIEALEIRLLSFEVGHAARELLCARGNFAYTSGWIHGKVESRYELANHILWLHQHRKPSRHSSGRLAVEGETSTQLVRAMRLRTVASQAVLKAVVKMIESPQQRKGLCATSDGHVWVTSSGVVDFMESPMSMMGEKVSMNKVGAVLRQFAASNQRDGKVPMARPPGAERGRWLELDLSVILEEGLRYGMTCDRVERMLRMQPDGEVLANTALAHQDDA